jgi:peroxiredoxin
MGGHRDPRDLPAIPPEPLDDGAADHLVGLLVPHLSLPSTEGDMVDLADLARDKLVLYIYPRTGRPGVPLPTDWDAIPGARGCTPQSCGFRDLHPQLVRLGVTIAGLSSQSTEEQTEAATRLRLPFRLLSDPDLRLATALDLPTFAFAGFTLYKRLTLIAERAQIVKVFYPVFPPDENAAEVSAWLTGSTAL